MDINRRQFLKTLGGLAALTYVGQLNALASPQIVSSDISISKLGILTDLHAHAQNTTFFAKSLAAEKPDLFIVPGDLSYSLGDYEGAADDYAEMIAVMTPILEQGITTYVMPGNHEQRETYARAIADLSKSYPHLIDATNVTVLDYKNLTIVGFGGTSDSLRTVSKGFVRKQAEYDELAKLARSHQTTPILFATHAPQKYTTAKGLDAVSATTNVGDKEIAKIRASVGQNYAISGHIHEAFGIVTRAGIPVGQDVWSESLDINPGAVHDHKNRANLKPAAGMLEFQANKARARIYNM